MKLNSLVTVSGVGIWNEGTISFFIIHYNNVKISILHKMLDLRGIQALKCFKTTFNSFK